MSVKEKLTAVADMIRAHLVTEDKYSLNEMPQAISDVYLLGDSNGFAAGIMAGIDEGIEQGKVEAKNEMFNYGFSLSEALTSGDSNIDGLEANINQAKSDITAIKTLIENHGVEVPVGTLSSTYDETIEQIITDEKAEGIEQGKQAQYDEFWDAYQKWNGSFSVIYSAQFFFGGSGWDDNTFKPKYSMGEYGTITNASNMFQMCSVTNVTKILEEQGVTFNFANAVSFTNIMGYSKITHFPDVVTTSAGGLTSFLSQAYNLESIGLITLRDDGRQTFASAFYNCPKLKDISFAGVIGNDISFSDCPLLSKASITSIIEHLSDTATGKTLTLNKTAKEAAFTTEEWATITATKTNWTISLV